MGLIRSMTFQATTTVCEVRKIDFRKQGSFLHQQLSNGTLTCEKSGNGEVLCSGMSAAEAFEGEAKTEVTSNAEELKRDYETVAPRCVCGYGEDAGIGHGEKY